MWRCYSELAAIRLGRRPPVPLEAVLLSGVWGDWVRKPMKGSGTRAVGGQAIEYTRKAVSNRNEGLHPLVKL